MLMKLALALFLTAATLAACEAGTKNPATEPARPVDDAAAAAPPPDATPRVGALMPGTGAQNFVGRWTADVSWCLNDSGPERPIEITTTRFEGYENSCAIDQIDESPGGYLAYLTCQSEGATRSERARFSASGQKLRIAWLDRDQAAAYLTKCTTLGDTTPTGPSLRGG